MNQATYNEIANKYAHIYPYGATAKFSNDEAENRAINIARYQNLNGFLDGNQHLTLPTNPAHCQRHLLLGGQWSCFAQARNNKGCVEFHNSYLFDHDHSFRVKGLRKSHILVTHPYHDGVDYPVQEMSQGLLKGLKAVAYPSEMSWYYPDRTLLIFIARPELLEMLSLEGLGEPIEVFDGTLER